MNTDAQAADVELVTMSDILQLNNTTWDRPRSSEELDTFITRREAAVAETNDD